LAQYVGATPTELFGKTRFPTVREIPYLLTLGPHGFYWFGLEKPALDAGPQSTRPVPTFESTDIASLVRDPDFESVLLMYLSDKTWFGGSGRVYRAASVSETLSFGEGPGATQVILIRAECSDVDVDSYALALAWVPHLKPDVDPVAWVDLKNDAGEIVKGALVDASSHPESGRRLLESIARGVSARGDMATLRVTIEGAPGLDAEGIPDGFRVGLDRKETTLRFGDRYVMELFRRPEDGTNPELQLARVTTQHGNGLAPPLLASVTLTRPHAEPTTLALVHGFVSHAGTGWDFTVGELGRYYDRVLARQEKDPPPLPSASLLELADSTPPDTVAQMIAGYPDAMASIAKRIAEMHLLFASTEGVAFLPERDSPLDWRSKYQSLRNLAARTMRELRAVRPSLAPRAAREADALVGRERDIFGLFEPMLHVTTSTQRIRVHGSLHLGHVLHTGKDFVLTRAGGDRRGDIAARLRRRSPLRDLASMIRSLEFAADKVLLDPARVREGDIDAGRPWAVVWTSWVSAALLKAYLDATRGASFVPSDRAALAIILDAFILEGALYQLSDLLQDPRAEAVTIPLWGIANFLETRRR
jgi:maltose alpha-D-glucosyltransferase / alpha-amylase